MAVKKINKSLVVTPNARSSVSVTTTELPARPTCSIFFRSDKDKDKDLQPHACKYATQEPDLPSLPSPQLVLV
jgi:hypothetical protein